MGVFCTSFGKICYKSRNFVEEMLDDATSVILLYYDLFFSGSKDSLDSFHVPQKSSGHITKTRKPGNRGSVVHLVHYPTFSKANFYQLQHFTQSLNLLAIGTAWFRTDATAQYIMGDSDRNVVYFGVEFFFRKTSEFSPNGQPWHDFCS